MIQITRLFLSLLITTLTTTTTFSFIQHVKHDTFSRRNKSILSIGSTFSSSPLRNSNIRRLSQQMITGGDDEKSLVSTTALEVEEKPCYYRSEGKWKRRLNINNLSIGQKLYGRKLDEDLLYAKTGPKIFFECGMGRIDSKNNWQIVNGMLRLGTSWTKKSVIRKKVSKLSNKQVELYISRIRLPNAQVEVCLSEEEALEIHQRPKRIPRSKLTLGEQLEGTVKEVRPYGVIVDVGATTKGLLHIQKIADELGRYIDKEDGLKQVGLDVGEEIRVCVSGNERKRLFFDWVRDDDDNDAREEEKKSKESTIPDISEEEASAWAAYSTQAYENDDDDDFDEDRDIEDALGIGTY